jgi:hypothetical protein
MENVHGYTIEGIPDDLRPYGISRALRMFGKPKVIAFPDVGYQTTIFWRGYSYLFALGELRKDVELY